MVYYTPPSEKSGGIRPLYPPPKCPHGCRRSQVAKHPVNFSPLMEKYFGHSLKIWTLPDNSSTPLVSQARGGLGFNQDEDRTIITESKLVA